LATYHPSAIVCSVEPKARETGALVAVQLGIGYEVDEGLHEHERHTAGYLAAADFHAAIERLFALPDSLVFGEETARQAQDRFAHAVEQAVGRYPQETIAHVTWAKHMPSRAFPMNARLDVLVRQCANAEGDSDLYNGWNSTS
jgi:broad specificity phosphatase PhoE